MEQHNEPRPPCPDECMAEDCQPCQAYLDDLEAQLFTPERVARAELSRDLKLYVAAYCGIKYMDPRLARDIMNQTPNLRTIIDEGDTPMVQALLDERTYLPWPQVPEELRKLRDEDGSRARHRRWEKLRALGAQSVTFEQLNGAPHPAEQDPGAGVEQ